jgi:hypothetical protein
MNGIINRHTGQRPLFRRKQIKYLRNENTRPKECLAFTSSFPTEARTSALARHGFRPTELQKVLWDAGIARDLSSSGRAGDHERNNVENRSNPAKLAPASGPSLVSLSPGHLLASRPSCLRKLVCAGTIMEFPGGNYSPSSCVSVTRITYSSRELLASIADRKLFSIP